MNDELKMMNDEFKMMNDESKMMNFVLKIAANAAPYRILYYKMMIKMVVRGPLTVPEVAVVLKSMRFALELMDLFFQNDDFDAKRPGTARR